METLNAKLFGGTKVKLDADRDKIFAALALKANSKLEPLQEVEEDDSDEVKSAKLKAIKAREAKVEKLTTELMNKATDMSPEWYIRCLTSVESAALEKGGIYQTEDEKGDKQTEWSNYKLRVSIVAYSLVDVQGLTKNGEPLQIETEEVGYPFGRIKRVKLDWIANNLTPIQVNELAEKIEQLNTLEEEVIESINFTIPTSKTGRVNADTTKGSTENQPTPKKNSASVKT
jgi:hypothetical protein